jgi:hypothetical protein
MCTIALAKVQRNYNCYNVYFYECLPYNLIVKKDKDAAKAFATKLQAIHPENEIAKQILDTK